MDADLPSVPNRIMTSAYFFFFLLITTRQVELWKMLHWFDVTNVALASRRKVCVLLATLVWWLKKGCGFRCVCLLAGNWDDHRLHQRTPFFRRSPLSSQAGGDLMSNGLHLLFLGLSGDMVLKTRHRLMSSGVSRVVNRRECPKNFEPHAEFTTKTCCRFKSFHWCIHIIVLCSHYAKYFIVTYLTVIICLCVCLCKSI